jgi:hypothetical protein
MPAHRIDATLPNRTAVPLASVLLALLMIVTICLLSIAAADSSIEPSDGGAVVTAQ